MLLGMARKSVGDVTFYRADGQQRSRVRNRNPKNPKSPAQCVQRMVLSTASKIAQAYRPIINHSFEGVAVGSASERYFQKITMKALRNAATWLGETDPGSPIKASFDIKGAPTIGYVDGLVISRGSLSMRPVTVDTDFVLISTTAALASEPFSTQEAYEGELAKLGLLPGDQLSVVAHLANSENRVATIDRGSNFAQAVRFLRVTFVKTIPANFSGVLFDSNKKWNPALVDSIEGNWPDLTPVPAGLQIELYNLSPDYPELAAAAVIRSQYDEVGVCHYSPAKMSANTEVFDDNNADWVWPSYADGAQVLMVGDPLFLRNAVASLA